MTLKIRMACLKEAVQFCQQFEDFASTYCRFAGSRIQVWELLSGSLCLLRGYSANPAITQYRLLVHLNTASVAWFRAGVKLWRP